MRPQITQMTQIQFALAISHGTEEDAVRWRRFAPLVRRPEAGASELTSA